ncbi:ATP-binding protein [Ruminococcus sp.]|uniref:ATP-binding protein n=1 Tax=Ruminococcus sp. TaxID=41978 RepID=UPI0025FBDFB7|nr:ATP-binding protein [Ruminococcus sp.]
MPFIPNNPPKVNSTPLPSSIKKEDRTTQFSFTDPKYKLSDLIISDSLNDELQTIIKAQECWRKVFEEWNLGSVLKQRKNLFINLYGAPGTGKTMAAHAIAESLHKKMICVNYSDIESKYVGETSKNLTSLFHFADESKAIIFFDEADALLSKRVTNMSSSTDVSVNQTRSVLLTLLNDYDGMVIFATNFISNYDSAFMRRIQYHVKFELPNAELRCKLWKLYIPKEMPAQLDIDDISKKYDGISGSDISNAVLKAALKAAKQNNTIIPQNYFEEAIERIVESKKANSNSGDSNVKITKSEIVPESEVPPEVKKQAEQNK